MSKIPLTFQPNERMPSYWHKLFTAILKRCQKDKDNITDLCDISQQLICEYKKTGYVKSYLPLAGLKLNPLIGLMFYNNISRKTTGRPLSPVAHFANAKWMTKSSYCFLNIRATGKRIKSCGNLIDVTRILPLIRAENLHIAPFFYSVHQIPYCQKSFMHISKKVVHHEIEKMGVSRIEQLKYFADCVHILNKTLGFDLVTHTSHHSWVSFSYPNLFRWIKLSADKSSLYQNESCKYQYTPKRQNQFISKIVSIRDKILDKYGLISLEAECNDSDSLYECANEMENEIKLNGYWCVPPHTWNGVGVPGFKEFNHEEKIPFFTYLDAKGQDQGIHSIGLHSAFSYYKNMPINRKPCSKKGTLNKKPQQNNRTAKYLANVFPRMHREFGFDFIRIDYVDHLMKNSTFTKMGKKMPINDGISPWITKMISKEARKAFKPCGMLADHMGTDINDYSDAGFNAILGPEVKEPIDQKSMNDFFNTNKSLGSKNRKKCATILYPIDTHDIAHPMFMNEELLPREGALGIGVRHFISLFGATTKDFLRPKYEVIGMQDLSTGIHRANNSEESLKWGSSKRFFQY